MPLPSTLPLAKTVLPATQEELAETVRQAFADGTPIYPLGGGTGLAWGLPAKAKGWGLSLEKLNRVVDYPARDMTVTVEAGTTMASLAELLAKEGQRLPVDVPQASQATVGGVAATNFSGSLRYAHGTPRDQVIGITAVDGRGVTFHGGGRVVKNVAGYDLCKLLCGSHGTLAVITQLTFKLKPLPAASAWVMSGPVSLELAERLLISLVSSRTTPAAIELLAGAAWKETVREGATLAVLLEGTAVEVDWQVQQLQREWHDAGQSDFKLLAGEPAVAFSSQIAEFPAADPQSLVLKANLRPGAIANYIRLLRAIDPACSIQAHAGNGIVISRSTGLAPADASQALLKQLQPAAREAQGNVVVLSAAEGVEPTRRVVWGNSSPDAAVMQQVKDQFDPRGLLNPGRFVYGKA